MTTTADIIAAKRDGRELEDDEIRQIVLDYTAGRIPDYQMSAFLMAAYIRGLSFQETMALTRVMIDSGDVLNFSAIPETKVDKHSSGGVGDKTTIVLVPMLAACGLKVPKMSGRGLGFSGGTIDKIESIPGLTTALDINRFIRQVADIGAAIAGQTANIVPADKKIYALRDVTATVDSVPLIAASIMSKKIACGSDVILVDVKVGSGAFMPHIQAGRYLSQMLMEIGRSFGRRMAVAVTDMNQPLGRAVGNALEVAEAIETLQGGGPSDLRELCIELSAIILNLVGHGVSQEERVSASAKAIDSGDALCVFKRLVEAQGGDVRVIDDPSILPRAAKKVDVISPVSGVVESIDGAAIGRASCILGAGRERIEDTVDPAVGIVIEKKLGDRVVRGDCLAVIHANNMDRVPLVRQMILGAYSIGNYAPDTRLIHEVIY
ncbi:MAG: thymidine phosphorylase [Armatimonadetes bacterium]|nr:thymidine phosphorylase [Armatimonadota bacterium]